MGMSVVTDTRETAMLVGFYATLSSGDVPGCGRYLDADVVRVEPAGNSTAGRYQGRENVLAHLAEGRGTWAEGYCLPEGFLADGQKVIALLHVRVRRHGHSDWIEGRLADVFAFSAGRIALMRTFWERQDAIHWVERGSPEV